MIWNMVKDLLQVLALFSPSCMNSKLTGEGNDDDEEEEVKKTIAIFTYKQRLLSLDMKTKVVQHVLRINLSHFNFLI